MVCVDNTCKNETAVKGDVVDYTYKFTQNLNVSDLNMLKNISRVTLYSILYLSPWSRHLLRVNAIKNTRVLQSPVSLF